MTFPLKLTEREFMDQVTQLAEIRGWQWAHFRPAQTAKGWRTPVSGPLGKGWPDLVLVREKDRRLIFAELKRNGGKLDGDQERVLRVLWDATRHPVLFISKPGEVTWGDPGHPATTEVVMWTPAEWGAIEEALR